MEGLSMAHAAKKDKPAPLVPKLRFKEFEGDGEWVVKQLIDITDKKIKWSFVGGPFGSNLKHSDYTEQGIRIIQLQNIGDAEFIDTYKIYTSTQKADELLSCNIYSGDIILSKMGDPVGRACIMPMQNERYLMCSDGIRFVVNERKFDKYFIYLVINGCIFRKLLEKTATGSTRKRIGLNELRKLPLNTPTLPEQQRIANCLTSLDEQITAQSQKLETLKAHKKGLMQKLFPAEGKSLPELRFKEFAGVGEWKMSFLEKCSNIVRGGSPRPINDFITSKSNGLNWLKIGDVDKNAKYITHTQERVRPEALSKSREINAGDLILSNSMSFGRPYISKIKACIHDGWIAITNISNNFTIDFVYYIILSPSSQKFFISYAAGSGVLNLNADIIKSLKILFPNKQEQQRIADCLTSIDDLTTLHTRKIALLKEHKKGLMQQLFPCIKEQI